MTSYIRIIFKYIVCFGCKFKVISIEFFLCHVNWIYPVIFNISEQQYFELEKQLITANTKLETESNSSAEFKEKNQELGKSFIAS